MKALLFAFVAGSALALQAADSSRDLYVSINGTMLDRYSNLIENVSTDLAAVLKTASTGDTIWVEDGYVWEGVMENEPTKDTAYCRNALVVFKAVTIRSVSGIYDEAKKLGVTIKGQWAEPGVSAFGPNAVRCLRTSQSVTLRGIIFENGATCEGNQYYGGAAMYSGSGGRLYDCLIRNCQSGTGSAVRGAGINTILTRCVITNCNAVSSVTKDETKGGAVYNASVYDCEFRDNVSPGGGAIMGGLNGAALIVSNCVFIGNVSDVYSDKCGGGAIEGDNIQVFECAFTNNSTKASGGAIFGKGLTVWKSIFFANRAFTTSSLGQGGAVYGAGNMIMDSEFYDNLATNADVSASGGALYDGTAVRCVFKGNVVFGNGGAAGKAVLEDCLIDGNTTAFALNKDGKKNSSSGLGGGLYGCTATNCTIINNTAVKNHNWTGRGGGAYNCDLVYCSVSNNVAEGLGGGCFQPNATRTIERCLFVGNKGGTGSDATMGPAGGVSGVSGKEPTLVHCTLTGNAGRGVYNVKFEDCISWGNGEDDANIVSATHSCASVLTDEMGEGNVTENPKLRTKPAGYVYWPANPKCYNMGRYDAYGIGLMLLLR